MNDKSLHDTAAALIQKHLDSSMWSWTGVAGAVIALVRERDAGEIKRLRSAIINIMYIAHYGGLEGLGEPAAIANIRRLSLPWFDATSGDPGAKVRTAIAQQAQDEPA